ncbi:MAG: hypothetical protein KAS17_00200 [Victivallaceae bacterium]|nr:hypothetical protein [Victivallaceae bacterium]
MNITRPDHYEICLNGIWKFKIDTEEHWTQINVPGVYTGIGKSWGGEYWDCFDYPAEWEGKGGIYRRTFELPVEIQDKDIRFYCGACAHHSEVFLNGEKVGEWHDGYTPMEFSLSPAIKVGENLLELHVSSQKNDLFDDYGTHRRGIWQDCWLRAYPELCVENDLFIKTLHAEKKICCSIPVSNLSGKARTFSIECLVTELDGTEVKRFKSQKHVLGVKEQKTFEVSDKWHNPHLWFPYDPHLYYLHVEIIDENGSLIDNRRERFGFREITWQGPHLFINGQELFLRGHGGHYFGDIQGTREYMETWLGEMKKLGVNFMRLHDSPKHKELYDVADEMGIMLEAEAVCHFKVPEDPNIWRGHLERLVKAQRNRPSIILWSVSNELRWRGGGEKPEMIEWVKTFDTTRPVFASDFSLESRHGDICAHHYNPITVFEEWEEYGPDKPMIWDELGSVWQHDRPLCNGTSGYEVQAQDYATGLWHDGHDQILHDIEFMHNGREFGGELHRVNGFCPWDLAYIFFRWQATNNNNMLELKHESYNSPGIKLRHIHPGASPVNPWDTTLPAFEPNPGYYLFEKYMKAVRFFDDNKHRAFFASQELTITARVFYDDTRPVDSVACLVETETGRVLSERIIYLSLKPGQILENAVFVFDLPEVSTATPVNLVREFRRNGESGYRDLRQAKIFPDNKMFSGMIYLFEKNDCLRTRLLELGAEIVDDIQKCDLAVTENTGFMQNQKISAFIQQGGKVFCMSGENIDTAPPLGSVSDNFSSIAGSLSDKGLKSETGNWQWYGYTHEQEIKIHQQDYNLQSENGRLDFSNITQSGAYAYAVFERPVLHLEEGEMNMTWRAQLDDMMQRIKNEPSLFNRSIRPMLRDANSKWYLCSQAIEISEINGQAGFSFADTEWESVETTKNGLLIGELKVSGNIQPGLECITGVGIFHEKVPEMPMGFWFSKLEWTGRATPSALIPLNGADHRILSGLGQEDFSFWRGKASLDILDIPEKGNCRVILAGNKDGIGSSLYEIFSGKGMAVVSSLRLMEKSEPAATCLIHNAIEYIKDYKACLHGKTCLLAEKQNENYFLTLGLCPCGFNIQELENCRTIIIDASSMRILTSALRHTGKIRDFVASGGQVLFYGANDKTIDSLQKLTDRKLSLTDPFLGERSHCVKAPVSWTHSDTPVRNAEYYEGIMCHQPFEPNFSPIISGIVNRDLYWNESRMFENGIEITGMDPVRPSKDYSMLISNWRIDWSKPGWGGEYIHAGKDMRRVDWFINRDPVLLQVSHGKGQFIFCQLDFAAGGKKGRRAARQILSNLGCSLYEDTYFAPDEYYFDFNSREDQLKRFEAHYRNLASACRRYYGTPEHLANPKQLLYAKINTLLLGDDFTIGYAPFTVESMWETHAVSSESLGNSSDGVKYILQRSYDGLQVIQFSLGFEDLKLGSNSKPIVSLDEFSRNLKKIVDKLKQTGAKLYWTNIIPIPEKLESYAREDVEVYNKAAQKIMDKNDVYTNDLNRFVRENFPEFVKGDSLEFSPDQLSAIAKQVAEGITFFGAQ